MTGFQRLVEATAADYEEHILRNPMFGMVADGRATRDHYVIYLRETYHLVRHTSRALAAGAARLGDERRELRAWLLDQANDEHGHELFCLKDLKHLGLAPERVTAETPGPGAWGVVTQNYYIASYGNPVALLGVASATEGMGAALAGDLAGTLIDRYGIPENATTFLRSHSSFDQRHLAEARRAVDAAIANLEEFCQVVHARRMTFRYYGLLFSEVAASTASFFESRPSRAA